MHNIKRALRILDKMRKESELLNVEKIGDSFSSNPSQAIKEAYKLQIEIDAIIRNLSHLRNFILDTRIQYEDEAQIEKDPP